MDNVAVQGPQVVDEGDEQIVAVRRVLGDGRSRRILGAAVVAESWCSPLRDDRFAFAHDTGGGKGVFTDFCGGRWCCVRHSGFILS